MGENTFNIPRLDEPDLGKIRFLTEARRVSIITAFTTIGAAWHDADCSPYCPAGFTAVYLEIQFLMVGDGTSDGIYGFLRKNGSTATTTPAAQAYGIYNTNLGAGITIDRFFTKLVEVDSSGIFEYQDFTRYGGGAATAQLDVMLIGYCL